MYGNKGQYRAPLADDCTSGASSNDTLGLCPEELYFPNKFFALMQIGMIGAVYVFWMRFDEIENEFWRSGKVVPEFVARSLTPALVLVRVYLLVDVAVRSVFLIAVRSQVKSVENIFYSADFIFSVAVLCFLYFVLVRPLPPGKITVLKPAHQVP